MMIFINHVPRNIYENFTSRNFGFSDAAEAFVLMSGIAVGLAYSKGFKTGDLGAALLRVWRRAGTIYVAHIVTSAFAIAILAYGVLFLDAYTLVKRVNFAAFMEQPLAALLGLPTLTHQLGYFNILPLYFVLLLVSPLYIIIGLRSRWALVAFATLVWFLAGTYRLNLPNYPNPGGWFFNPFSWQLLYAIGIAAGLSAKEGKKLIPFQSLLFGLAAAFLVFSLFWIKLRMGGLPGARSLPFFIGSFDKTFLALPRLLHILALAYVLTNLTAVSRLLKAQAFRPLELMGQNSLAVFATGSVLSIALQVFRARFETTAIADGALLLAGIFIQYWVAYFLSVTTRKGRAASTMVDSPLRPNALGLANMGESRSAEKA